MFMDENHDSFLPSALHYIVHTCKHEWITLKHPLQIIV